MLSLLVKGPAAVRIIVFFSTFICLAFFCSILLSASSSIFTEFSIEFLVNFFN